MKTLALVDGTLHDKERTMLQVAADVFGVETAVEDLESIEPDALAVAVSETATASDLMQRLVILSTLDAEVCESEIELMERYGAALGIEERAVHNLRQLVAGNVRRMAFDLGRRSFMPVIRFAGT